MNVQDSKKLLTPSEVAKRLGVSPITVRSWVSKGWLKSKLTPGGHRRYLWDDVSQLLHERKNSKKKLNRTRILVVDDDPDFRAYMFDSLTTLLPNQSIREAADGFEAGIAMSEFKPDLVLLDYAMPNMDGAKVCQQIKSSGKYENAKVVAMTGYSDPLIEKALFDSGVDKVLHKPISLETIKALLIEYEISIESKLP